MKRIACSFSSELITFPQKMKTGEIFDHSSPGDFAWTSLMNAKLERGP